MFNTAEAGPGPHDSDYLFKKFVSLMLGDVDILFSFDLIITFATLIFGGIRS